jgi:hypothetical protein
MSDGETVATTDMLSKIALPYEVTMRLLAVPMPGDSVLLGWRPVVTTDGKLRRMAPDDARS